MATSDYKRLTVDLLAASVGYSIATVVPTPVEGMSFYIFNGLTEPDTKDGIWIKTEDEMTNTIIKVWIAQNSLEWNLLNNMPYGAMDTTAGSVGNNIYVCGGYSTESVTRIYNVITGAWATGPSMIGPDRRMAGAGIDYNLYMCSGSNSSYRAYTRIYNTLTGVWSLGAVLPSGSAYLSGLSVDKKLYVSDSTMRIYDTETGTWTTKTGFSGNRLVSGYISPNIYLCGGYSDIFNWIYNIETGAISSGTAMIYPGSGLAGGAVRNKMYVCGGAVYTRIYDITTGVWLLGPDMVNGSGSLSGLSLNEVIYVFGGYDSSNINSTRRLTTDDTVDYKDGTVIAATGTLAAASEEKIVKIADNIELNIADIWIAKNGHLVDYETYYGDGVTWNLVKII